MESSPLGLPIACALGLGVVTAVGGGLMRDVAANEIPAVFNGSNLHVTPAATGAALTVVAVQTDLWGPVAAATLSALVFAFRMVAWREQWRFPAPVRGWTVRDIGARLRKGQSVFGRPGREERYDDNDSDPDNGRDPDESGGRSAGGRR